MSVLIDFMCEVVHLFLKKNKTKKKNGHLCVCVCVLMNLDPRARIDRGH